MTTLTRAELVRAGVTRDMAEAWRDFYLHELGRNPLNPSAAMRLLVKRCGKRLPSYFDSYARHTPGGVVLSSALLAPHGYAPRCTARQRIRWSVG
jgi:hypothetical protein